VVDMKEIDGMQVVSSYEDANKTTLEGFIKDCIREMLLADNDTLHVNCKVEREATKIEVQFDIVITNLEELAWC